MSLSRSRTGSIESLLAVCLLAGLLLIGIAIFIRQSHYDLDISAARPPQPTPATAAIDKIFKFPPPPSYKSDANIETFNADTLYNKIDGKAELYLEAGFKNLSCLKFLNAADPNTWMEFYIYDMAAPLNAFSVFSRQKRAEAVDINLTEFAYKTPDAVFLAADKYYVEILGSNASPDLVDNMLAAASNFVNQLENPKPIAQFAVFDKENLIPHSYKLYLESAFSFEGFKNVFAASYNINSKTVSAFMCKTDSPDKARITAVDYKKFLVENGARPKPAATELPKDSIFDLDGSIEIVFANKNYVAGVHAAPDQTSAEIIAAKLYTRLEKLENAKLPE